MRTALQGAKVPLALSPEVAEAGTTSYGWPMLVVTREGAEVLESLARGALEAIDALERGQC